MTLKETRVLIIGAGPTGLALACDLARRGVTFAIIDKAETPFIGSKGKGLQPRSLEVFDDFGVIEQILGYGRFHLPFRAYDGATVLGEMDIHEGRNPTPSRPYASTLILPQWRVEETLRGLLQRSGDTVQYGTDLVALQQDEQGVTATLRSTAGEATVRTRYLVASDGGRSFVRKTLEVPFEGETWKNERMYVGDVRLRGLDRDAWHAWPKHPDGFLTLCPLPSTDQFQLQALAQPGEEREPSLEIFRELVQTRTGGMDIELIDTSWLSLYRANVRMVSRYRAGNVFLAGDAAHVHSPAGGQGMNTGIQDAYNLGWKLGAVLQGAPEALLDTYEEERLPVAAHVLGISTKLHRQMVNNSDTKQRDDTTLQLGISYSGMSLARQTADVQRPLQAGDRAPDAPGQTVDGTPMRLFDAFRGTHFTLLRLSPESDNAVSGTWQNVKAVDVVGSASQAQTGALVFVDASGHAAAAYGSDPGLLLVRPDGYLGWIGTLDQVAELSAYLALVSPS